MVLLRIIILVLLFAVILSFSNVNQAAKTNAAKEQKLEFNTEDLIGTWVAMWNSYDLFMVDKLFLTDSTVTYFSSEKEGLIRGIDAVREHHAGFGFVEGGKVQENRLWLEDVQTDIYGSAEVVTGIWFFRRGPEGSDDIQRGPVTFVYVQKVSEYRIAHVNFGNYE